MYYGYSIKKIIKFTLPMILNVLVMNLMFTVDRLFLTKYSLDSMNAASVGGSFAALILFFGVGIAHIASVFVGQYNGSKEYHKIGRPVWQMIYFSLGLAIILIPLGFFCEYLGLFPPIYQEEGTSYLRPLLMSGWMPAMGSALVSFFVGRGKSFIVIIVFAVGNLINCLFDWILIFGVSDVIPAMGAKGAAYATIIGELFFLSSFWSIFLKKKYREKFGTLDWKLRPALWKNCVKIGFPVAMGMIASQLGWMTMMICFSHTSRELATCESFAILIWMSFIFFADGCARSITSLSSNLIGRGEQKPIENLLKLFLTWHIGLSAIFMIPLIFYQTPLLEFVGDVNSDMTYLHSELSFAMMAMWLVLLTDGIYYLIRGILNSGGDTKFPMMLELFSFWIVAVIPTIVMFYTNQLVSIRQVYKLVCISQLIIVGVMYYRYRQKKWFKKVI